MKKAWTVVIVIVIIAMSLGAVSAGVGMLTGADFDRIGETFQTHIAEKYNVDANALIHEWIPQSIDIVFQELT